MHGASILVTGGTGSFGHALISRLTRDGHAGRVIVYSRDELKQSEMAQRFPQPNLRFFLGDVRDRDRLRIALRGVDVVFHAAALKHIPIGEYNPSEFIKTNILGTENVLMAAADVGVQKVLVLSTDKAAAPITLYGSTKSVAEHLTRAARHYSTDGCKFSALRYGNVAGSRGSVIPIWQQMLGDGATELPITHPKMTRFFFAIEDAVEFALWSIANMKGGELFVPQMPSFYVTDLATAMGCARTKLIGIRSAEKLAEVMVTAEEARYFRRWNGKYVRFAEGHEQGDALPEDFEYRSDNNAAWLGVQELRALLDKIRAPQLREAA